MKAKQYATVTIQAERSVSSHNLDTARKQHKRQIACQGEDTEVLIVQVTEGKASKRMAAAAFKKIVTYEQSVVQAKRKANAAEQDAHAQVKTAEQDDHAQVKADEKDENARVKDAEQDADA